MTARLPRIALVLALGALSACATVGPDYRLPDAAAANRSEAQGAFLDTGNAEVAPGQPLPERWWSLYQDPLLDRLVEQALGANAGLRAASANLERATAVYEQAMDAGGFDYEVEAEAQRAQVSAESFLLSEKLPVFNLGSGGLKISYDFDLFGKLRRASEAARADAQATQAALDLARVSVAAQVAGSYLEICNANHELAIARHSVELQQHGQQVAQRLFDAGRGTRVDVTRAQAQVAALQAALPPLQAHKRAAEYSLAALLGNTPGQLPEGVDDCAQAPQPSRPIPLGDGRALLARRPDVRAAERTLAAATARIGVATAELYPDIRLGASAGAAGLLEDFGQPATQQWSVGPLISWSIPSAGARARVHASEAGAQAALAHFDQTVLDALRETQTVLDGYAQDLQRLQALRASRDAAQLAAEQNRRLYQGGRAPYLASLDADRTQAGSDAQVAAAQAQVSQDQVKLFLALGGGWQQAAATP
ncbi:efflux transporter outer membrane subunit [Stenotrophomonas sp. MMGLT7]|uniref:efflux transporter outer membrane subunit n=1 Tax=Stenotrophomonas sp. MMGLT7 TaxID=2901227 RepID=UPI001E3864C0|nr:efflux transporter outer membrane subunit [Stenotrophomonas sp. MMGLT7]MCD7100172.1 efflux transporter outer membrane subunit [Stenotrophomonas sp. MMGLT7]